MTDRDREILIKRKRAQVFPSSLSSLFILLIGILLYAFKSIEVLGIIVFLLFSFFSGLGLFFLLSKNIRLDLSTGIIHLIPKVVKDKTYKLDYEPGSASVPVSFLSVLILRKISSLEMKEVHLFQIKVDDGKYEIDPDLFEKLERGDILHFRRAIKSDILLGIDRIQNP